MTGSTWTSNGGGGTGPFPGGKEVRTSQLANSTMETSREARPSEPVQTASTVAPAIQITVSHIFVPLKKLF
ncbi:MAG TPA: hypothetical protein VN380_17395 [Thermoanaerobaculia bacterium]|jgi:hypothetical protein|nr:hypothetical protein [Thermoanaerobaculia bacterium]